MKVLRCKDGYLVRKIRTTRKGTKEWSKQTSKYFWSKSTKCSLTEDECMGVDEWRTDCSAWLGWREGG